jgi:hypothetical protein
VPFAVWVLFLPFLKEKSAKSRKAETLAPKRGGKMAGGGGKTATRLFFRHLTKKWRVYKGLHF